MKWKWLAKLPSERKASEKAVQVSLERLKISNQELDQFAYIASHDLKEPLRGLANNALFLQEDYADILDDAGIRRTKRIRFLCTRMEQLVDKLLYYSRLGRQELAISATNIGEIIDKVKELTVLEESNTNVMINITADLPNIICDKTRITELFRNLISNAIKYNNQEIKQIDIGVAKKKDPISHKIEPQVFYVKDNGMGISAEYFEDVFKMFKRLNEEDDDIRGSGVGLAFVKKIIERHNGSIWLESRLGKGTCFYFTLKMEVDKHE